MITPIIFVLSVFGGAWIAQNKCNCEENHKKGIEIYKKSSYNCIYNKRTQKKRPSYYH